MNRLAGEERAIVTPLAGTTRDSLREPIQIQGVPLVLVDTAGLRIAQDEAERLGVERTREELRRADLVLAVGEAGGPTPVVADAPPDAARLFVYNKADLLPGFVAPPGSIAVSAKTGEGVETLRRAILEAAGWRSTGDSVFLARERHLRALQRARAHLQAASGQHGWELFAEELRLAHAALAAITGEFSADDLLAEIFARFCIGK
jgi:tRNA modification GTPase